MANHPYKFHSSVELIDAIKRARDTARVRLHLLSLEAKDRLHELEGKLLELQSKLEHGGEQVASGVSTAVHDLTQAVKELLPDAGDTRELAIPVNELMHEAPNACSPSDSLARAAEIMWTADCGAVPVVSADGTLVGIITDRDLCMASYTRGQPLSSISVESTMSRNVYFVSAQDSLGRVAHVMGDKQVRRIPVTENGKLVGMISLADIARYIRSSEDHNLPACVTVAHTLAKISDPRAEQRAAAE